MKHFWSTEKKKAKKQKNTQQQTGSNLFNHIINQT
jgi:hypothetical protein